MNILIILLFVAALFVYLSTGTSRKKQSTIKKEGNVSEPSNNEVPVPCTGEWGPWDTDCESIACGTSITKTRQWKLWVKNPDSEARHAQFRDRNLPIIPCPSDCVQSGNGSGQP